MGANEEYVRSVWGDSFERVFEDHRVRLCCGYPDCDGDLPGEPHEACCPAYIADENYWSAARAYTEGVLEQVRQLRDQIAFMGTVAAYVQTMSDCSGVHVNRIVARLEAELTRLTAGMKPEKAGSK